MRKPPLGWFITWGLFKTGYLPFAILSRHPDLSPKTLGKQRERLLIKERWLNRMELESTPRHLVDISHKLAVAQTTWHQNASALGLPRITEPLEWEIILRKPPLGWFITWGLFKTGYLPFAILSRHPDRSPKTLGKQRERLLIKERWLNRMELESTPRHLVDTSPDTNCKLAVAQTTWHQNVSALGLPRGTEPLEWEIILRKPPLGWFITWGLFKTGCLPFAILSRHPDLSPKTLGKQRERLLIKERWLNRMELESTPRHLVDISPDTN